MDTCVSGESCRSLGDVDSEDRGYDQCVWSLDNELLVDLLDSDGFLHTLIWDIREGLIRYSSCRFIRMEWNDGWLNS